MQIHGLLSKPKVPRKDLEACIGFLMWATNISPVLRPYPVHLYRLLNSSPGANFSIAPRAIYMLRILGASSCAP